MKGRRIQSLKLSNLSLFVSILTIVLAPVSLFGADDSGSAGQFLGHLHPLVVHLPIGILFLAYLLEIFSGFDRFRQLKPATTFTLVVGSLFAVIAVISGLFLSREGGYQASTLASHKWLGICVAGSAVALTIAKLRSGRHPGRLLSQSYKYLLAGNALLLIMAGHLGGSLTHGTEFLTEVLPDPIRNLVEGDKMEIPGTGVHKFSADSTLFVGAILPILDDKCIQCHNPEKRKGKLELNSAAAVLRGGKNGAVIVPGSDNESELYRRLTLPEHDDEHMPPEGKRQPGAGEIRLIGWWLTEGATFEQRIAELTIPEEIQHIIDAMAEPVNGEQVDAGVLGLEIPPADTVALAKLRGRGLLIMPVSQQSNLLTVRYENAGSFEQESLHDLLQIADNVVWLDLSATALTDSGLAVVGQLSHLARLHLEKTEITDAGLSFLADLQYLEYLNLYGTGISGQGLESLAGLKRLKSLYLWQTAVTPEQTQALVSRLPSVNIDFGYTNENNTN